MAHKRVVVANYHVQEGLAGTVMPWKHCILGTLPAALHLPVELQPSHKLRLYSQGQLANDK